MTTLDEKWDAARSLPHANAMEEQEVKQQVESILRLKMNRVVDITRQLDVLRRVKLTNVSAKCMKQVVKKVCAALTLVQKRPHSFGGAAEGQGDVAYRGRCSRNGKPKASKASVRSGRRGRSPSLKCGCKFKFTLYRNSTLTIRNHSAGQMHAPGCQPETEQQLGNNAYLQTQLVSPSKIAVAVAECAELRKNDGNFTNGNIMRRLYATML